MFTEIKLTEKLADYIYPDTHKEQGRQIAKFAGILVCAIFWVTTVTNFSYIVSELNQHGSIIAVLERFGHSFFLFVASLFWLFSALCIYSSPRIFGFICITYIFVSSTSLLLFGTNKPYLSITNIFLCLLAVFILVQVIIAGYRSCNSNEKDV